MKIMIFGATGLIGSRLCPKLESLGHTVLKRDMRKDRNWSGELQSCDGVVNLSGANIFKKRWSSQYKEEIFDSRFESTKAIVEALGKAHDEGKAPKVFINGSAVGYYGSSEVDIFTEESGSGSGFLAFVCRDTELEALKAQGQFGVRVVNLRTGVVLAKEGGALKQMLMVFEPGLGGPIAGGRQFFPWIHIDDECGLIIHALQNESIHGALNAVAPEIETNKTFTKKLSKVLHMPAFLPVPAIALHITLGEVASIITQGQNVVPQKALNTGYKFLYPKIEEALEEILLPAVARGHSAHA